VNLKDIRKFGSHMFFSDVQPIKELKKSKAIVVGFDSEFKKNGKLLSIQFFTGNTGIIIPCKSLDWFDLKSYLWEFLISKGYSVNKRNNLNFILVCFFSIAELSKINNFMEAEIFETAYSYNAKWKPNKHQTIYIYDLFNWHQFSLKKVASLYGFNKLDYDVTDLKVKDLKKKNFIEYAINDAKLCYQIFNEIRSRFNGEYQVDIYRTKTVAQTAMTIFRGHYLKKGVVFDNSTLRKFTLRCCWGGNNQAFYRGCLDDRQYYEYDAVGMYSNCVVNLQYLPSENDLRFTEKEAVFVQSENKGGFCMVYFVFPSTCVYPSLPVFMDGKIIYPLTGESYCTLAELRQAKNQGASIEYVVGCYYRTGNDSLYQFIKEFQYKRENAKDEIEDELYKLMMNSIIGKFIQKIKKYDINDIFKLAVKTGLPTSYLMTIKDLSQLGIKEKIHVGSGFIPEWNGLVTGYARATLAKAFCDNQAILGTTDSLITDSEMLAPIINGITFEEKARGDKVVVYRNRLYSLQDNGKIIKIAHHGVHSQRVAEDLLLDFIDKKQYTYKKKHIIKLRESFSGSGIFGSMETKGMIVNLNWDNKRRLHYVGEITSPFNSADEVYQGVSHV